jgi:hypothetical protein
LKAFEIDWVLVFAIEGDAEAKSESESIQDLWRDRRGVGAKVVDFQVGGLSVESRGVEIGEKKLI